MCYILKHISALCYFNTGEDIKMIAPKPDFAKLSGRCIMRFTVKRIFGLLWFNRCAGKCGAGFFYGVDHLSRGFADTVQ